MSHNEANFISLLHRLLFCLNKISDTVKMGNRKVERWKLWELSTLNSLFVGWPRVGTQTGSRKLGSCNPRMKNTTAYCLMKWSISGIEWKSHLNQGYILLLSPKIHGSISEWGVLWRERIFKLQLLLITKNGINSIRRHNEVK